MNTKNDKLNPVPFKNPFSSYAVFEEPNLSSRKKMEDFTISEVDLTNDSNWSLFCVLDGHGGTDVAAYTKKNYPKILTKCLQEENHEAIESKIIASLDRLTSDLFKEIKNSYNQGSTLSGILIHNPKRVYFTINIGDSKVFKASLENPPQTCLKVKSLTEEHKISNKTELKRIREIHKLVNKRLGGKLMVTRSLGDFSFAKYGLSSEADVFKHEFTNEVYLVVATDGVWDVIDNTCLEDLLSLNLNQDSSFIAKLIAEKAILKSLDNISLIVISVACKNGNCQ